MEYLFPFAVTFAFSAILTRLLLAFKSEVAWLIRSPTMNRWHKQATPTLGGIAIFVAYAASLFLFGQARGAMLNVFFSGLVIFILGFLDDLRPLPPYSKLIGQIAAACLLVMLGVHVAFPGNPLVYVPFTVIWIVGITNAFNLLDNMDGLAGGIAVIAAFFLAALAVLSSGNWISVPVLAIVIGAIGGFLLFNTHPAKIFMGDCGSQWIGFTLAAFTILGTWQSASNLMLTIATPLLVLAVPIFDTTLVTLNRKVHGRPVSQGGRDHASHRLVALGWSERKTIWILWGLSALFGLCVLFAHIYRLETWVLVISAVVIFVIVFGVFLADAKVYEPQPEKLKERRRVPRVDLFYRRRLVDILIDTFLIGASYVLAYLLRYDWRLDDYLLTQIGKTLPLVISTKLILFMALGLYRGLWSYIDFEQFMRLFRISLIATAGTALAMLGLYRFEGFSRTVLAIDFGVLLAMMGGTRALLRAMRESLFAFPDQGIRLLVVGAGDGARFLLEEIRKNRHWNLRPVAIVDDDRSKRQNAVLGIPIVGGAEDIGSVVREYKIDRIAIAIPSISDEMRTKLEQRCRASGVRYAVMDSLENTLIQKLRT